MESNGDFLREMIRILVRNLGVLEKNDAECCGTTLAQCHAVVEIGRTGAVTLNELSEKLMLDKSTASRTVNNLVDSGLALREQDGEDRRYVRIVLTEAGEGVFRSIESSMETYYGNIFASIPEDKRNQVIDSLKILIEAIHENKCC